MSNIVTYLAWRGDLTFAREPFNEVDNLVLAEFAYFDFSGIVPGIESAGDISVAEAYSLMLRRTATSPVKALSGAEEYLTLWEKMARSARYRDARLSNYVDIFDEDERVQFAALHIALDDGTTYIAFRGTDQTILGWREDFAMSFEVVAAQHEAARYVEQTIGPGRQYRLGGHSKGGNLAVYAAMTCGDDLQAQIADVYTNDGPGFCPEVFPVELYAAIRDRVHLIVPEFCIIGNLYGQDTPDKIVKSEEDGLLQHRGMSWMVEGNGFVEAAAFLPECVSLNQVVDTWVEDVSMDERPVFVDEFFDALAASGSKNIDEVSKQGVGGFESVLTALVDTKKDTKSVIGKLIKAFLTRLKNLDFLMLLQTKSIMRGLIFVAAGLLFTWLPAGAVRIIAVIAVLIIVFFMGKRLVHHLKQKASWTNVGRYSAIFYVAAIAVLVLISVLQGIFTFSSDFALGILCCFYGYHFLKRCFQISDIRRPVFWFSILRTIIATMLGLAVLIDAGNANAGIEFTIGTFLILDGLAAVVMGTHYKIKEQSARNAK